MCVLVEPVSSSIVPTVHNQPRTSTSRPSGSILLILGLIVQCLTD